MVIMKKADSKPEQSQADVDDIISKGGKVSADEVPLDEEVRFTLRIPQKLIEKIDKDRENRIGNVSRNQWILEAIDARFS